MELSTLTDWLLDSDPALRWQVERDLLDVPAPQWQATRARVGVEGFGARLLAEQDADGQWAGGAFFPAGFAGEQDGQPWVATTWSLNLLREWGLDAAVLLARDTPELLARSSRWEYDGSPYWGGEVDCCINAWTVRNGLWLGVDMSALVQWFVDHQLADGGWNCEWVQGAARSSVHSTLNSLTALLADEVTTGGTPAGRSARERGEEYLLSRRLLYRRTDGEPIGDWLGRLTYPLRWRYSALRAIDYLRARSELDGSRPDPRAVDAIQLVRAARDADGTWHTDGRDPGRVWFEVDVPAGQPSRWVTFHALRALRWWDGQRG